MVLTLSQEPGSTSAVVADEAPPGPAVIIEHCCEPAAIVEVGFSHVLEPTLFTAGHGQARRPFTFGGAQQVCS